MCLSSSQVQIMGQQHQQGMVLTGAVYAAAATRLSYVSGEHHATCTNKNDSANPPIPRECQLAVRRRHCPKGDARRDAKSVADSRPRSRGQGTRPPDWGIGPPPPTSLEPYGAAMTAAALLPGGKDCRAGAGAPKGRQDRGGGATRGGAGRGRAPPAELRPPSKLQAAVWLPARHRRRAGSRRASLGHREAVTPRMSLGVTGNRGAQGRARRAAERGGCTAGGGPTAPGLVERRLGCRATTRRPRHAFTCTQARRKRC